MQVRDGSINRNIAIYDISDIDIIGIVSTFGRF